MPTDMSESVDHMIDTRWPRISQSTLADRVYEVVRDRILDGKFEPGKFIREQEIGDAMGVSRTPVREALGRLASEGFVERIPHRGFQVPAEPFDRLLELYPVVSALESLAGELAFPRLDDADLAHLREINARLRRRMDEGDVQGELEANNEFHRYIAERSGNRRLAELLDDLRSQLTRLETWYYSYAEHTERSISEHEELLGAFERGDLERALEILEENMALTYRALVEETGKAPDFPAAAHGRDGSSPRADEVTSGT